MAKTLIMIDEISKKSDQLSSTERANELELQRVRLQGISCPPPNQMMYIGTNRIYNVIILFLEHMYCDTSSPSEITFVLPLLNYFILVQ